ncbi:MAG: ribonuclease HI family protein [Acidobacteriaceae bacterium]
MDKIIVFTDGGARGNPGPAAIGYVIYDKTKTEVLASLGEAIGEATNNQAEYKALIAALNRGRELGADSAECFLDSELVVKQLHGSYKVREENLQKLIQEVFRAMGKFKQVTFAHIPREKNHFADKLVNEALDGEKKKAEKRE